MPSSNKDVIIFKSGDEYMSCLHEQKFSLKYDKTQDVLKHMTSVCSVTFAQSNLRLSVSCLTSSHGSMTSCLLPALMERQKGDIDKADETRYRARRLLVHGYAAVTLQTPASQASFGLWISDERSE